ncbi:hypothetical protein LRH25_04650 [Ideonella azotifigens]|uniref:Tox-REase-5 domain-containing protein n=1 Tax=Ideonella azotifigens TaxID=513160 RepID=A0ABP3VRF7_9BURK|nr:hypothetical protein [Ideonella azotifigens]MCD2339628.1 hypothetical protein [Ideonella azotifigens]
MSGSNQQQASSGLIDDAWSSVVGGFDWLKSVLLGEFSDHRSLSAMVADMLVSFVPGVVIVTSARDAVAVVLRLAQHPEKREEVMEWVMLSACLITLALPLVMAASGAVAAGVGAVVTGIAGSELGAALRAVMLLLIKEAAKLEELIQFLRKFMSGDIFKFLRAVKFAQYEEALVKALAKIMGKLLAIVQNMRAVLMKLPAFEYVTQAIAKLSAWEQKFYGVQQSAIQQLPKALTELQVRLDRALAQTLPKEAHTAASGVKAEKPTLVKPEPQRVADVPGRPLRNETPQSKPAAAPALRPKPKPKPAAADAQPPVTKAPDPAAPKAADADAAALKDRPDRPNGANDKPNDKKQATLDAVAIADRERVTQLSKEAKEAEESGDAALAAAKKEEARAVLRPYLPKNPGDSWDEVIKRLDVSSPKDGAVFWSGDAKAAQAYAESIHGVTLETTSGGRIIDGWDEVNKGYPWNADSGKAGPYASDLWKGVSAKYAEGATGDVNLVQTPWKLWDPGTIWQNQEKPMLLHLQEMGQIDDIGIHVLNSQSQAIPLSPGYIDDLLKFDPRPPPIP